MAKQRKMDFEALYGAGENPKGMTAQTANGTAKAMGTGWNKDCYGGEFGWPEVEPGGAWQEGRSNRTGE